MTQKQFLKTLTWNTFERYPAEGSDIYIYFRCTEDGDVKFFTIKNFSALTFNPKKFIFGSNKDSEWVYSWQRADVIDSHLRNFLQSKQ